MTGPAGGHAEPIRMARKIVLAESESRISVQLEINGTIAATAPDRPFAAPFTEDEFADLAWYLEEYLYAPYGAYGERGPNIGGRFQAWGERLFERAIGFDGAAHELYLRACGDSSSCAMAVVSDSARFLSLPWELLKDPAKVTPLALDFPAFDRALATPGPGSPRQLAAEELS